MDEEDSTQDFSLESEQPGKRRAKDSKKDGKKKKKRTSTIQDTSPGGGKSAHLPPGVHKDADGYSVSVTPVHVVEDNLQSHSPKLSSIPKGKNPASRKNPEKVITFKARPDSSQSRLTGQPSEAINVRICRLPLSMTNRPLKRRS